MKYDIQAVETVYKGITFRSRLEATWAAMFDLLGWRWEYECDPINGWLPDFILTTPHAPHGVTLVEIKPLFIESYGKHPEEWSKVVRNRPIWNQEVLLLGYGQASDPFEIKAGLHLDCLWYDPWRDFLNPEYPGRPCCFNEEGGDCFGQGSLLGLLRTKSGWDFCNTEGSWWGRISGDHPKSGTGHCRWAAVNDWQSLWGAAKRIVRYRPR